MLLTPLLFTGCMLVPDFRDVAVEMRDGHTLATDVYLADTWGEPAPIVLLRTPYGKALGALLAPRYTRAGAHVVVQDTRGSRDLQVPFMAFLADGDGELQDGHDTHAWIVEQPFSDGTIVSDGVSALGIIQYSAAPTRPPGNVGLVAGVATPAFYEQAVFPGGVFRESLVLDWLGAVGAREMLTEIEQHPYDDDFWGPMGSADRFADWDSPGVHYGGWFDIFPQGPIDAFVGAQQAGGDGARGEQKLLMGPWTHGGLGRLTQGELTFPLQSLAPPVHFDDLEASLLAHTLGVDVGGAVPWDEIPAVQLYVMGDVDDPEAPGNEWRSYDAWPPPATEVRYHLGSEGLLAPGCTDSGETSWTFDPLDPSGTVCGGNLFLAAGSCDQAVVEDRTDTVLFETELLTEPLELVGRVRARLQVSLDQPDADVVVRLTDVYPDGRSMLITDGAARVAARGSTQDLTPVEPGEVVEVVVDLWSTAVVLDTGHRLRISVTNSNWPKFEVNPGSGMPWPARRDGPADPIGVTLHHAGSALELPVAGALPQAICRTDSGTPPPAR